MPTLSDPLSLLRELVELDRLDELEEGQPALLIAQLNQTFCSEEI